MSDSAMEGNDNILDTIKMTYRDASASVTWSAVFTYGLLLLLTWLAYKAFLEPFLSPLRKVPGMTFNPFWGNMRDLVKGEAMEYTIKIMKEYGSVCRYYFMFGRERLMIADPDVMKHVLVTNSKNYQKPQGRMKLMRMVLGDGLVMLEGSTHAAHKRLMSPFFNNYAVKKMIPVLVERSQKLADHWLTEVQTTAEKPTQTVEIQVQGDLAKTTLDIVGQIAFGYDFDALKQPNSAITTAFQNILTGASLSWKMALPFYHKLPTEDVRKFKAQIHMMKKTVMDVIDSKRRLIELGADQAEITGDVLGQMLLARDEDGNALSAEELQAEVMTLMLAGHETTAVGMSWLLMLLAQNPVVQERAREEVLRVLPRQPTPDNVTWDHMDQLKYCSCIVKETLRMYPPVPITLRQSLGPDTFHTSTGQTYYVPGGTISQLSMGPMMRRPDLFDSPNEFVPERFLDTDTDQAFYNYLPFLIGHRMCVGYKFALMEMRVMMALLLRQMSFETVHGVHYKRQLRITMRPSPAMKLNVKPV